MFSIRPRKRSGIAGMASRILRWAASEKMLIINNIADANQAEHRDHDAARPEEPLHSRP